MALPSLLPVTRSSILFSQATSRDSDDFYCYHTPSLKNLLPVYPSRPHRRTLATAMTSAGSSRRSLCLTGRGGAARSAAATPNPQVGLVRLGWGGRSGLVDAPAPTQRISRRRPHHTSPVAERHSPSWSRTDTKRTRCSQDPEVDTALPPCPRPRLETTRLYTDTKHARRSQSDHSAAVHPGRGWLRPRGVRSRRRSRSASTSCSYRCTCGRRSSQRASGATLRRPLEWD